MFSCILSIKILIPMIMSPDIVIAMISSVRVYPFL